MKRMMNLCLVAGVLLSGQLALAGAKRPTQSMWVTEFADGTVWISADFGLANNGTTTYEYAYTSTRVVPSANGYTPGYSFAGKTPAGNFFSCSKYFPSPSAKANMEINAIQNFREGTSIGVRYSPNTGECLEVRLTSNTVLAP